MQQRLWKNWFLILLGFSIMVLPWTGFPGELKKWLYVGAGFLVVLLAFATARSARSAESPSPRMSGLEEAGEDDELH